MNIVRNVLQVLHMSDQQGLQLAKVTVIRVVHLHHAPGVLTTPDGLPPDLHQGVGSTHGEGEAVPQLGNLLPILLVLVRVYFRELIDLDTSCLQLLQDPRLEFLDLPHGEAIRLGDDGDDVDLAAQLLHELQVQRLQSVAVGRDKIQAAVHSVINYQVPANVRRALSLEIPGWEEKRLPSGQTNIKVSQPTW